MASCSLARGRGGPGPVRFRPSLALFGRNTAVAITLSLGLWLGLGFTANPPSAAAASPFEATASTDLVRIGGTLEPAILVPELVDAGALTTQTRLTSLGDSMAFCSTPYPGSLPTALPGMATGLFHLPISLPEYPLLVSSSYPSEPDGHLNVGTLSMSASSAEDHSDARINDGANAASASVRADGGEVVAEAQATVGSIELGAISIGGIRTFASVTRAPDGQLERKSEFSVASVNILGQQLRLTENGLELPESSVPVGLGSAVDPLDALLASLSEQGIALRVLNAEETVDGVRSAGLEISRTVDTGVSAAVVTVTLGRVNVAVSGRVGRVFVTPSVPRTSFGGGIGSPRGATPTGATDQPASTNDIAEMKASSLSPELAAGERFYPVLVIAAVALGAMTDLFRKRGVKLTWLS